MRALDWKRSSPLLCVRVLHCHVIIPDIDIPVQIKPSGDGEHCVTTCKHGLVTEDDVLHRNRASRELYLRSKYTAPEDMRVSVALVDGHGR